MMSFCDYLGLSNACSYDVDDVIGRLDQFGFQNFCSPGPGHKKRCLLPFANNKDADQPAHPPLMFAA